MRCLMIMPSFHTNRNKSLVSSRDSDALDCFFSIGHFKFKKHSLKTVNIPQALFTHQSYLILSKGALPIESYRINRMRSASCWHIRPLYCAVLRFLSSWRVKPKIKNIVSKLPIIAHPNCHIRWLFFSVWVALFSITYTFSFVAACQVQTLGF